MDWLILELERRSAPFLRFNTEDYPSRVGITWRPEGDHVLCVDGVEYGMRCFPSVWYRRPISPDLEEVPEELRGWARGEALEALNGLWRTHEALWVNHPDQNQLASFKQGQLRVAAQLGFAIPRTIVTNSAAAALRFSEEVEETVCKPLRDGRIPASNGEQIFFTSKLDASLLGGLDELGPEPYLFQELVPKEADLRVTVIGDEAFAVQIESQAEPEGKTDWRRVGSELRHRVVDLPATVERRCVQLVRFYGLNFGAIDLARRPDGGFTFFEINPNGQWAWIEQLTGQPLRSRLADLLMSPC